MRLPWIAHLVVIGTVAGLSFAAALLSRRNSRSARTVRLALAAILIANELAWYAFRYSQEGIRFPEGLPLELCDISVWVTAFALLRRHPGATGFAYFAGAGGALMALLSPDLWAPLFSYPTLYFMVGHGAVVIAAAALVLGRQVRLGPRPFWRAFALLNLYAAAVGVFNVVFYTNYFYLCDKPESASLLDWFGPWPYYILTAEVFTLAMFVLLWIPARRMDSSG